jgi:murein endopeptidase
VRRAACALLTGAAVATGAAAQPPPAFIPIHWHRSVSLGQPWQGRLRQGVQLPAQGPDFFTWDPVRKRFPDRGWRRWGHDRLIRTLLRVLREYRAANLWAPRVGVADISRRRGGIFDERFGGRGHSSHQNGLDVDVLYPRKDLRERQAFRAGQIDGVLAQDVLDRFVAAGAKYVFVGPHTRLKGPHKRVQVLAHHDDHMHVRLRPRPGGR